MQSCIISFLNQKIENAWEFLTQIKQIIILTIQNIQRRQSFTALQQHYFVDFLVAVQSYKNKDFMDLHITFKASVLSWPQEFHQFIQFIK